ncbi:MAG: hypothetical protein NTV43_13310 [Methylococcales bacterium]|nr:hypothetical protein [Methylococcales bacterium]
MTTTLWRHHILPFSLLPGLLAIATLTGDYYLHRLDLVWVGRYLGILGTFLILLSFIYSLRKRKYISVGKPKTLLAFHEASAWLGSLFVLIHAGIHFNAILPWLATVAMGVNVISGLVGKWLLGISRRHVQAERDSLKGHGLSIAEVEQALFWDAKTLAVLAQWRKVHIPIFSVFVVLALGHILSIFLFWAWS